MKKSFLSLAAVGAFLLSSCGPSAEEKAAAEKATQDSIAAVEKATADSMAMVAMQDSMNMAMEKMRQDSIAMADSLAAATAAAKPGKPAPKKPATKKEEPKKEEPKKNSNSLKDKITDEGAAKKDTSNAPKKLKDKLKGN